MSSSSVGILWVCEFQAPGLGKVPSETDVCLLFSGNLRGSPARGSRDHICIYFLASGFPCHRCMYLRFQIYLWLSFNSSLVWA